MEDSSKVCKGRIAYHSLFVLHQYKMYVREVYAFSYKRKLIDGGPAGAYTQFYSAVGQFLHFAIVYGVIYIDDLWTNGATFKAISCMDLAKHFELL